MPLNERITWLNEIKPNSFLPIRSRFAKCASLGIYAIWAHINDQTRLEKVLKAQETARNECVNLIVSNLPQYLNDKTLMSLKDLPPSEFRDLIFNNIFNELGKLGNIGLIQKSWAIIPCDSKLIQNFITVLHNNSITSKGAGGSTVLQTVTELHRWDLVENLIKGGALPNDKGTKDKTPLELLLLQKPDQPTVTSALNALYGKEWKKDKGVALILRENFNITGLNDLYGQEWKKDKAIALALLEKHPSAAFYIDPLLKEDKNFWLEAVSFKKIDSFYYIPEVLNRDEDFWIEMLARGALLSVLPITIINSDEFWIKLLEKNSELIGHLPAGLAGSKAFWIEALAKNNATLNGLLPKHMRESREFWINALAENNGVVGALPEQFNNLAFWSSPIIWKGSTDKNVQLFRKLPAWIRDNPEFLKTLTAIKMQRRIRGKQIKKKIKNITPEKVEIQKQQQYSIPINKRVRQPLEDLTKHTDWISGNTPLAQARKAVTKAAKLGSYEKFELALRGSFEDTLHSIYLSPPKQRKYVIIADEKGKSSNWVMAHLQDLMSVHPPSDIVSRENLAQYLIDHKDVEHVVMVDDGTYSGEQASRYIEEMTGLEKKHKFHVTIPYMTNFGKKRLATSLQKKQCEYFMHNRQMMLSYDELVKVGDIFSFTGRVIVDSNKLSKITQLPNENELEIKTQVNQKLIEIKELFFSKGDEEEVYKKILETILFIDSNRETLGEEGNSLMRQLFQAMEAEQSESQHNELLKAYTEGMGMAGDKTASWFSHKGADYMSTNYAEMLKIAGKITPVEPYKDQPDVVRRRKEQINNIKKTMVDSTLGNTVIDRGGHLWLKDRVDFVHTNRGFFLLGNSYLQETLDPPIILHINGKKRFIMQMST